MASDKIVGAALKQLELPEQVNLLDAVDQLRAQGLSKYVELPQVIVCGDQSSGKSSVLEGISTLKFPTKKGFCTRFATVLILRKAPECHAEVSIMPAEGRSKEQQDRLLEFKPPFTGPDDFPSIIEQATETLNKYGGSIFEDRLVVEYWGPDHPHLTLVDLPGLIKNKSGGRSDEDIETIYRLVRSFMAEKRSIILAIIAASNDSSNHSVFSSDMIPHFDPEGTRTIGVITKPDMLDVGSEDEHTWVELARNTDIKLALGWHVLKNRSNATRTSTTAERDEAEEVWLAQGSWRNFDSDKKGIDALRRRLSDVFLRHVCSNLPAVISEIKTLRQQREEERNSLGDALPTIKERRNYLTNISTRYHTLADAALDGRYHDGFFPRTGRTAKKDVDYTRLRALICKMNEKFAADMYSRGHRWQILYENNPGAESLDPTQGPTPISLSDYVAEVRHIAEVNRGRHPPGTCDPMLITELFRQQSEAWFSLAHAHVESVWEAARSFIDRLLRHITKSHTYKALWSGYFDKVMDDRLQELYSELEKIMKPHRKGHVMTYSRGFTQAYRQVSNKRRETHRASALCRKLKLEERPDAMVPLNTTIGAMLQPLSEQELARDDWSFAELIDCSEAYYELTRDVVIDNVAALVLENCLIEDIPTLITPNLVNLMDEDTVDALAAEPEGVQDRREELRKNLETLEKGLKICTRYVGRAYSAPTAPVSVLTPQRRTPSPLPPRSTDRLAVPLYRASSEEPSSASMSPSKSSEETTPTTPSSTSSRRSRRSRSKVEVPEGDW